VRAGMARLSTAQWPPRAHTVGLKTFRALSGLWINLWKLWIAEGLLHGRGPEDALRATIAALPRPSDAVRISVGPVSH